MSNVDWKKTTVNTYNKSAKKMAEYFAGIGSRSVDVKTALKLAGNPKDAEILEIGCGDGRDAAEIIKQTPNYSGFDISEGLIELALERLPRTQFEVGDAVAYNYSSHKNLDVVFAFASLLHLDKAELKDVLAKVFQTLKPGGIFYISLKYRSEYTEEIKEDRFGKRIFYFYNPELIAALAGDKYKVVYKNKGFITGRYTEWFVIALKRKP